MARVGVPVDSDGSDVWVLRSSTGTDVPTSTAWDPPLGVEVVWLGELSAGGDVLVLEPGHWSHCAYTPSAAFWVTGYGVRAWHPLTPSWVPLLLLSRQEWFWRVRSSSWCSSWWATWSGLGFFRLLGGERGMWEFRLLSGLPSYSVASGAGAHRALVVDVPVIIQLTFLQYFENVEVPQIPSSSECSRLQLYYRGVCVQCKLCKHPRCHSAVLGQVAHAPVLLLRQVLGVGQCRKLQLPLMQFLVVSDTPVVFVTTGACVCPDSAEFIEILQTVQLGLEAWAAHFLDDELWVFFRALYTGAGPGVVSTGTRPL